MSWLSEIINKIFGSTTEPVAPPAPAPVPVAPVEPPKPIPVVKPVPAPASSKKKVPSRDEVNALVKGFVDGTIPTRVGPYKNIKETKGKNRSPAIDQINTAQGATLGDPYCQAGMQEVLSEKCRYYSVDRKSVNIPRGPGTQDVWAQTPIKYKLKYPEISTWINWRHGHTGNGHTGEVVAIPPHSSNFTTMEFNTSAAGQKVERDGEGFYFGLTRNIKGDGDMIINGYIDVYQALVDAMLASGKWEA